MSERGERERERDRERQTDRQKQTETETWIIKKLAERHMEGDSVTDREEKRREEGRRYR